MQDIGLIFICLGIGVALRLSGRLPDNAHKALGGWVINVALPAAALHSIHGLTLNDGWWLAAATPWLGAITGIIVFALIARAAGWSRRRAGALMLTAGWANTSFVGLPMIAAFAGTHWLGLGIVIDLFGSYLALSTIGFAIATIASAGVFSPRLVLTRIATFPPFIAIVIALATNHLARPDWLTHMLGLLADTLTPLALAAVGYALRFTALKSRLGPLCVGLGYRLLIAPALLMLLFLALGRSGATISHVTLLEMAMPPSLGASIIAMDHNLDPELAALLIGIGVPLSILTAWGWWSLAGLL